MNLVCFSIITCALISSRYHVDCISPLFGDRCVEEHNILRRRHVDTNVVSKSKGLENAAKQHARMLRGRDTSFEIHPTRNIPRRKRRSLEDGIDDTQHLELWEGDISYPTAADQWLVNLNRNSKVKIGRSIHKFCCSRYAPIPHCPKEFFHGLSFPPTAEGVVSDVYSEEEKHYDYGTGKSKTIYSHINHFARIVWKNTTQVGCGQSLVSGIGCVFTVMLYQIEGGVGGEEVFMKNIGLPIVADKSSPATSIVLAVFVACLIIGIIVLVYCCRHNIDEKYKETMVEIDVMKAEQELETDSTNFWWIRPLKSKGSVPEERPSTKVYTSIKEKPSIEIVMPKVPPRPSLTNLPRHSLVPPGSQPPVNVNQLVNRYRGMSLKRQDYMQMNFAANPVVPPSRRPVSKQDSTERVLVRTPSGKSAPPPPAPNSGNNQKPLRPKPPASTSKPTDGRVPVTIPSRPPPPDAPKRSSLSDPPKAVEKPRPVPRKLPTVPSGGDLGQDSGPAKKPMVPPKKHFPIQSLDADEERPLSVSEMRKLLEDM